MQLSSSQAGRAPFLYCPMFDSVVLFETIIKERSLTLSNANLDYMFFLIPFLESKRMLRLELTY